MCYQGQRRFTHLKPHTISDACVWLQLLTHGADVHHMGWTPKGGTALHEAVQAWIPKNVISLLLQNGKLRR